MSATLDLTEDQVTETLGNFLAAVLPIAAANVFVGQENQIPEPTASDFVVMWPIARSRLGLTDQSWQYVTAPTTMQNQTATEVTVQVDIHGPSSADNAQLFADLWQSDYGCAYYDEVALPMRPLRAEVSGQVPFINGEGQFENRWVVKAVLQANVTVSTTQDFADTITVDPVNVEAAYPA